MHHGCTLYDLAKELGLSVATTSKALNGYKDVSEKTRARVLQMAKKLKYEPSIAAQSITTKRSFLIGIVLDDLVDGFMHPHFAEILQRFRETIEAGGYQMLFINNQHQEGKTLLQKCRHRGLDGVLVVSSSDTSQELCELMESDIPLVVVAYEWEGCTSVLSDNRGGMALLVRYLWEKGHRKFAYISAPLCAKTGAAAQRYHGLMEAAQRFDIFLPQENIVFADSLTFLGGYRAQAALCAREIQATVVMTAYDIMAVGAMSYLQEAGIAVPAGLSVTGFDDLPTDHLIFHKLTTVRQHRDQIGKIAGAKLLEQMMQGTKIVAPVCLPVTLVERSSVQRIDHAENASPPGGPG